jgi:hypothetical protein
MTTLTIKQAKELGQELVLGTAIKSKVTTAVHALYIEYAGGLKTDKPLIALWEQCATDKPTLAVIRSIFNRVTKAVHKELDMDKPAMCVKDGQLVEVQKRSGKGGGSEGAEGGEGEHTLNAKGEAVPVLTENTARYKAAFETLIRMAKKEKDAAKAEALSVALNLIAVKI